MGDNDEGLANSSLSTSRVPPQDGQKPDSLPPNGKLPGNDQQRGLDATEPSAPKNDQQRGLDATKPSVPKPADDRAH